MRRESESDVVASWSSASRVCTEQIQPLLSISENGALLLNLSSHPRTVHAFFLYSIPARRVTQGSPGKPTTTSCSAISAEIKCGCPPRTCVGIALLYDEFFTTQRTRTRTSIWFIGSRLLCLSVARIFRQRTSTTEKARLNERKLDNS